MRKKEEKNRLPYLMVLFQFSALFGIMFTGPLFASGFILFGIQISGVFLGIWSIYVMRIGNFNIIPVPVNNGVLRLNGPYRLIRHPMYTSIILFTLPELIYYFTYWRLAIFIILIFSLIIKLGYEEKRLIEKHPDYLNYRRKTKRLIPFLY